MKKIIIAIFMIVFILVLLYFALKYHYNNHKYDMSKLMNRSGFDAASTFSGVFENNDWSELCLSENFRNKYKKATDIIPEIGKYNRFSSGYDNYNNNECILLFAEQPESFFDRPNSKPYAIYYFNYNVINGNLLDGVKLVKVRYCEQISGKDIETKVYE